MGLRDLFRRRMTDAEVERRLRRLPERQVLPKRAEKPKGWGAIGHHQRIWRVLREFAPVEILRYEIMDEGVKSDPMRAMG